MQWRSSRTLSPPPPPPTSLTMRSDEKPRNWWENYELSWSSCLGVKWSVGRRVEVELPKSNRIRVWKVVHPSVFPFFPMEMEREGCTCTARHGGPRRIVLIGWSESVLRRGFSNALSMQNAHAMFSAGFRLSVIKIKKAKLKVYSKVGTYINNI